MSKITAEHLARSAIVYIRQSTADTIKRASAGNMGLLIVRGNSVGSTSR